MFKKKLMTKYCVHTILYSYNSTMSRCIKHVHEREKSRKTWI